MKKIVIALFFMILLIPSVTYYSQSLFPQKVNDVQFTDNLTSDKQETLNSISDYGDAVFNGVLRFDEIDNNSNGLIDYLRFTFEIDVCVIGNYSVYSMLLLTQNDPWMMDWEERRELGIPGFSGIEEGWSRNFNMETDFANSDYFGDSLGLINISVVFRGDIIRERLNDGPYRLVHAGIFNVDENTGDGEPYWVDEWNLDNNDMSSGIYDTPYYSHLEFDPPLPGTLIIENEVSEEIIDSDSNLLYDTIKIRINITSAWSGDYVIIGHLGTSTTPIMLVAKERIYIPTDYTVFEVELEFSCKELNYYQYNGSYSVTELRVYNEYDVLYGNPGGEVTEAYNTTDYRYNVYNTSSYNYTDFEVIELSNWQTYPNTIINTNETQNFYLEGDLDYPFFNISIYQNDNLYPMIDLTDQYSWEWGFTVDIISPNGKKFEIFNDPDLLIFEKRFHDGVEFLEYHLVLRIFEEGLWKINIHNKDVNTLYCYLKFEEIATDITPPTVHINSHSDGSIIDSNHAVTIHGEAFDFLLDRVELYIDDIFVTEMSRRGNYGPFIYDMSGNFYWSLLFTATDFDLSVGTHILKARAVDFSDLTADHVITITINILPEESPEDVINKGLTWLARQQNSEGSFDWHPGSEDGRVGITGLATLALIQGGIIASTVLDAINYLLNKQVDGGDDDGAVGTWYYTYETSMTLLALSAYNQTLNYYDTEINDAIDRAFYWLERSQNDETWGVYPEDSWYGGWRYGHDHESSDLSQVQWVLLSLVAANRGPEVEPEIWEKALIFVNRTLTVEENGEMVFTRFGYQEYDGGGSSSMTGAGIWCLWLAGEPVSDWRIQGALNTLNRDWEFIYDNDFAYGSWMAYYYILTIAKALEMTGPRDMDTFMQEEIRHLLVTRSIIGDSSDELYWNNEPGDEPSIFATAEALLALQIKYGDVGSADRLIFELRSPAAAIFSVQSNETRIGYNFENGLVETGFETTYTGLYSSPQFIEISNFKKGSYNVTVTGIDAGLGDNIFYLKVIALDGVDNVLGIDDYPTTIINPGDVYCFEVKVTTFTGVNVEIYEPQLLTYASSLEIISKPVYEKDFNQSESDIINVEYIVKNTGAITLSGISALILLPDEFILSTSVSQSIEYIFTLFPEEEITLEWVIQAKIPNVAGEKFFGFALYHESSAPQFSFFKRNAVGPTAGSPPTIDLLYPTGGEELSGIVTISWNAEDPDGDSLEFDVVLINSANKKYSITAKSTQNTTILDTTEYNDGGGYRIEVIARDNNGMETTASSGTLEIKNGEGPQPFTPGFEIPITIIVLVGLVAFSRRKQE